MEVIREALYEALRVDHPMTVRQVFYRLTTLGVIDKTEAEYKGTVCRLLGEMRRSGDIPYDWLSDATRWMRKPTTYSSVEEALRRTADTYRRNLWDDSDVVEVWLEKEALAGVLVEITEEWDVPLMVTRGYPSMSFLFAAAHGVMDRARQGRRTHIYYFGDRDPSGVDIDRAVVQGIGEGLHSMLRSAGVMISTGSEIFDEFVSFERVAVTEDQIVDLDLPSRPTKKTDSRAKTFKGESVELDAIPPDPLRELAREVINRHVDHHALGVLKTYEDAERRDLEAMADRFGGTA